MNLTRNHLFVLVALFLLILNAGCSDRDPTSLEIARAKIDPLVFDDGYGEDVYFQAFSGTYLNAVTMDSLYAHSGTSSMKITVPGDGSALGAYSGGVLTSVAGRDMADFNALTFYARSSVNSTLNVVGFGNDNTGNSLHEAGRLDVPLTPDWAFVIIPIPAPSKIISERGLLTFAEGWENLNPQGHEVYLDDIKFAKLGNITNPRPFMPSVTKQYFVGSTASLQGTYTTFDIDGADVVVEHMAHYFDFESSDPAIATVERGVVKVVGLGEATISATLEGAAVEGSVSLSGYLPPTVAAPNPTHPAADVTSMLSGSYHDVPVDTWNTRWQWSTAEDSDYTVAGNVTKMYTFLNFVGIEFATQTIDASAMTHLHMDVFAPEGTNFSVKIVAFDGDEGLMTGQAELTFDGATTPAFVAGQWSSLEIPLTDFGMIVPLNHIGQIVLSTTDAQLLLVDNMYWHK